jgi:AcrR family transcriptional regulator
VLAAAGRLFVERGYAGTSMADIATAADVSPRTVFGGFGSKTQLLKQALDAAIVGDAEPVPLHERPSMRRFHESTSLAEACAALAAVFAEVGVRAYAVYNVVHRAADSEPEIAALERDLDQQRLTGVGYMTDTFARLLRVTDPTVQTRVRDTLWVLGSPLQYGLLVHDRGWSVGAYQTWIEQALLSLVPASADDRS